MYPLIILLFILINLIPTNRLQYVPSPVLSIHKFTLSSTGSICLYFWLVFIKYLSVNSCQHRPSRKWMYLSILMLLAITTYVCVCESSVLVNCDMLIHHFFYSEYTHTHTQCRFNYLHVHRCTRWFLTHPKINLPLHLGALPFQLTTKVRFIIRPVSDDGYTKVSGQDDSITWLIDVPLHQRMF